MEGTPEELGMIIFSNEPEYIDTMKITLPENLESIDYSQILFRLLFAGLDYLIGGLHDADIKVINDKMFEHTNKWFNKLGYELTCVKVNENEIENLPVYCKIYINRGQKKNFFKLNNSNERYRVIYSPVDENKYIEEYICIFDNEESLYAINFSVNQTHP
jgi:hypothetical protein